MTTSSNENIFRATGPLWGGIHRSPVNSPHKGQWPGALMFCLICALNKRLIKPLWLWWFETPSRSLWRYCNECFLSYDRISLYPAIYSYHCYKQLALGLFVETYRFSSVMLLYIDCEGQLAPNVIYSSYFFDSHDRTKKQTRKAWH